MRPLSVVALFCESIREEKGGIYTLLGVQGDNVFFAAPPAPPDPQDGSKLYAMLPRFACFVRFSFDPDMQIDGDIKIELVTPDGTRHPTGGADQETIAVAKTTKEKGNPLAGLTSRLEFGGVPVPLEGGRILVVVTVNGEEILAGALNFLPESARPVPSA